MVGNGARYACDLWSRARALFYRLRIDAGKTSLTETLNISRSFNVTPINSGGLLSLRTALATSSLREAKA